MGSVWASLAFCRRAVVVEGGRCNGHRGGMSEGEEARVCGERQHVKGVTSKGMGINTILVGWDYFTQSTWPTFHFPDLPATQSPLIHGQSVSIHHPAMPPKQQQSKAAKALAATANRGKAGKKWSKARNRDKAQHAVSVDLPLYNKIMSEPVNYKVCPSFRLCDMNQGTALTRRSSFLWLSWSSV